MSLACWLPGTRSAEQRLTHRLRGELFESLVVSEIVKAQANSGRSEALYFFRDAKGLEVDLLRETGTGLDLIEI